MFHITPVSNETPVLTSAPTPEAVRVVDIKFPVIMGALRYGIIIFVTVGTMTVLLAVTSGSGRGIGLGLALLGTALGFVVLNTVIRFLASIDAHIRALVTRR